MRIAPKTGLVAGTFVYSWARALNYSAQYAGMLGLSSILPGRWSAGRLPDLATLREIRKETWQLLWSDARVIGRGAIPWRALKPETPWRHARRIPGIVFDGARAQLRKHSGRTTVFSREARKLAEAMPRYYARNFHFQRDGYLSRKSAELYDHQVEILFSGTADAMRRILVTPLKERLRARGLPESGKGLRFLELGAGTGSATRFVRLAFPEAKIVAVDLSEPYLGVARGRGLEGVDFLQGDAGELPFRDGMFDLVYSVFLFHELPEKVRMQVLAESSRVLKPGGLLAAVDSIQKGDHARYDGMLENFPLDYHEPFYRNYIKRPMRELIARSGYRRLAEGRGLFSKYWVAEKARGRVARGKGTR